VRLTRGERDRTTLLLRCAAEVAVTGDYVLGPSWHTAPRLGFDKQACKRACDLATRAVGHVARQTGRDPEAARDLDEYLSVVLEAALCVEEKAWPSTRIAAYSLDPLGTRSPGGTNQRRAGTTNGYRPGSSCKRSGIWRSSPAAARASSSRCLSESFFTSASREASRYR